MCAPHIKIKLSMPHIELGDTVVPVSTVAKNIGVFLDDALSMNNQVQHICRVAYFHIHCIGQIRNLLDRKTKDDSYLKRCCPAHNQNEETRPHHCCFNRSSLASYQTADRVQIVTVDLSKHSWTSCIIHNRPTNSLRTNPCATLRGRSPTGGSTMQTTYAGRKGIFECCSTPLEQSAACHACHGLPQFFQEGTEDTV